MSLTLAELDRFNGRTSKDGDCVLWTGALDKDGYGTFYLRRRGRRAHRVAYFHAYGAIPVDCVIHHACQTRHCVNPAHLRLATVKDNNLRESNNVGAINARKTHCKNGHPFDRKYGGTRYCSVCEAAKTKRLRAKWKAAPDAFTGC